MKATFLNPFGAVLNALKASWIVKLAAVFAVGVPVSFADLVPSGTYVASSYYVVGYNSNTNVPSAGQVARNPWNPWGNPCISNNWFDYTSSYKKRSIDSEPKGYRELELCITNNRVDEYDDVNFWPVYIQADPQIVFDSVNYPGAQWDLLSRIVFAVDIEEGDGSGLSIGSSDCWVVGADFDYIDFSGNDWVFLDPFSWIDYDPINVKYFGLPFPYPRLGSDRFDSQEPRRVSASGRRATFKPPDRSCYISFWAWADHCDDDD